MARRIRLNLMENAAAGDGAGFDWPGGRGLFMVDATFGGGSVALQQQIPSGTWVPLNIENTATACALSAAGALNFAAPAGQIRAVATTASAVNAYAVGIPANEGG